jgi:RimJ/RimL family protein N-acetyltransferase
MGPVKLLPEYPVRTSRLRLRPLTLTDVEALHAYRSLDEVCRFIPPEPMDRDALADRISGRWSATAIEAEGTALILGIELADPGVVIGDLMLAFTSAKHRVGELGWVINPQHAGHGYATEAAHALMHLAFDQLGLHRVVARIDSRNAASLRLGERLGMRREAHLIANEWFKGEWSDEIDLALLEQEWTEQHLTGPESCAWRPGGSLAP